MCPYGWGFRFIDAKPTAEKVKDALTAAGKADPLQSESPLRPVLEKRLGRESQRRRIELGVQSTREEKSNERPTND